MLGLWWAFVFVCFHIWDKTINLYFWDGHFPPSIWKGEPGVGAWGPAGYYEDANRSPCAWVKFITVINAHRSEFQFSVDKMVFWQSFFFAQFWPQTICSRLVWALKYSRERILCNTKASRRFNGEETVISLTTALPTVKNMIRRRWWRRGSPWDGPD